MKSWVIAQYHYILNGDGSQEIYNLENDPFENQDLIKTVEGTQAIEKFLLYMSK